MKVFLGDLKDDAIRVDVTGVRYEDGKAFVDSTATINGDDLSGASGEEFPEYWVRQDGEWKVTTDDPKPCNTDSTFGGTPTSDETPAASGPGTSRAEAVDIGTTARAGETEYTVISVNFDAAGVIAGTSSFPSTPAAGNRYVQARVRVKATGAGEDTVDVGVFNFSMTGSGNTVFEPYGDDTSCGFDVPDELDAKLYPGGMAEGNICIQVPKTEQGLILIVEPQFSFDNKDRRYLALE